MNLVKDIHRSFVIPGVGVHWKMLEDLSEPYPVRNNEVLTKALLESNRFSMSLYPSSVA